MALCGLSDDSWQGGGRACVKLGAAYVNDLQQTYPNLQVLRMPGTVLHTVPTPLSVALLSVGYSAAHQSARPDS